jgi:hypothetical protein
MLVRKIFLTLFLDPNRTGWKWTTPSPPPPPITFLMVRPLANAWVKRCMKADASCCISCSRFTGKSHRLSCTFINFDYWFKFWWELMRVFATRAVMSLIELSVMQLQLLFSFDRGMRAEITLMQILASQLSCRKLSLLNSLSTRVKFSPLVFILDILVIRQRRLFVIF